MCADENDFVGPLAATSSGLRSAPIHAPTPLFSPGTPRFAGLIAEVDSTERYNGRQRDTMTSPSSFHVYDQFPTRPARFVSTQEGPHAQTRPGAIRYVTITVRASCSLRSRKVFLTAPSSSAVGCTLPLTSVTREVSVCSPDVAPFQSKLKNFQE